jgi:hypothetical protein
MNRFIEHSQVVTTDNYNTLKITANITHEIKSSMLVCQSLLGNTSQLNPWLLYFLLKSLTNESQLRYRASAQTPWKTSLLPSNDVLLFSRPLKRTGVYRVLHNNEHSTDPQRALLLLLCSLQRVYCIAA